MVTFNHFADLAAYLMVSVARIDGNLHYLEEATLKDLLKDLFPSHEGLLERAETAHKSNPGLKIEEVLKAHEGMIRSTPASERQSLLEALFGIVNSDGKVQQEETSLIKLIRSSISIT